MVNEKEFKALKTHLCSNCGRTIEEKEYYYAYTSYKNKRPIRIKRCHKCKIRNPDTLKEYPELIDHYFEGS